MSKILIALLACSSILIGQAQVIIDSQGAIIRSDTASQNVYLCFTGHDYFEGFEHVLGVLQKREISASFFLTGDFVRNHPDLVQSIAQAGHFVGAHSDKHLLYCEWSNRDSLRYTPDSIKQDIVDNLLALAALEIYPQYFMPPYEWYNRQVVEIAKSLGQLCVNFTPGTRSNADYTYPAMANYVSSQEILQSITDYEMRNGFNGFHLLIHPGTNPLRKDKLYLHLDSLIMSLAQKGYQFKRF